MQTRYTVITVMMTACICSFMSMGVRQSFGLFLDPLVAAQVVSNSEFSLSIALQNIIWGIMAPVFGMYVDRHGFVRMVAAGGFCYAAGLAAMSFADGFAGVLVGQCLVGIALAAASMSMMLGAAGKAVQQKYIPIALGLVSAVASLGQFAMAPLVQSGIDMLGWQSTLLWLMIATLPAILMAPLLALPKTAAVTVVATGPALHIMRLAMANSSYILLTVAFFVCGFQVTFVATHLPTYLTSVGHSTQVAAWSLALIGMFNILGSLAFGWLGFKFSRRLSLVWLYFLRSVAIAIFIAAPQSSVGALLFGAVIGLLWLGTIPLTSALVADFFGQRHMAMLYGVVFLMHQAGAFCGAWAGGLIYDLSGSYQAIWIICIVLGLVASVLHLPIKEGRDLNFAAGAG